MVHGHHDRLQVKAGFDSERSPAMPKGVRSGYLVGSAQFAQVSGLRARREDVLGRLVEARQLGPKDVRQRQVELAIDATLRAPERGHALVVDVLPPERAAVVGPNARQQQERPGDALERHPISLDR